MSDLKRSAKNMKNFIFALMPLAIGIFAISILKGWILVRPHDPEFSADWRKKNRTTFLLCAILSTSAGICGLLFIFGILKAPQQ
jgi:F0F1-type ATP synthase membrane subunit c/vacuolar-type H+-ATPase subunit K